MHRLILNLNRYKEYKIVSIEITVQAKTAIGAYIYNVTLTWIIFQLTRYNINILYRYVNYRKKEILIYFYRSITRTHHMLQLENYNIKR